VKIFGIPLKIEPTFFIIAFFLGTSRGSSLGLIFEWIVIVFFSVLLHELGHALTARLFRLQPSIVLAGMGGLTYWNPQYVVTPIRQILITLAGPFAGFFFGLIVFLAKPLFPDSELAETIYFDLLWVNIGWGIFNLLPMLPMDGGHVLGTLEQWIFRKESQVITHAISIVFALCFLALALRYSQLWIGILAAWFTYSNVVGLISWFRHRVDRKHADTLTAAQKALDKQDFALALNLSRQILSTARSKETQREASGYLVFALVMLNRFEEARQEITKFEGLYGAAPYMNGLYHFRLDQHAEAIPWLKEAFTQTLDDDIGTMLIESLTRENRFAEAVEVLKNDAIVKQKFALAAKIQYEAFNKTDFESSATAGSIAFQLNPDANVAYNNACAFARSGELTKGLYWLELAINEGFDDRAHLTTDPDLELLRQASGFASLLRRIPT
jgi:Zn-dependent protease